MQDTVFIEGLQIDALIGVHDWERHAPRPLVFDLQLAFDNRVPGVQRRTGRHPRLRSDQPAPGRLRRDHRLQPGGDTGGALRRIGAGRIRSDRRAPEAVEAGRGAGRKHGRRRPSNAGTSHERGAGHRCIARDRSRDRGALPARRLHGRRLRARRGRPCRTEGRFPRGRLLPLRHARWRRGGCAGARRASTPRRDRPAGQQRRCLPARDRSRPKTTTR